MLGNVDRKIGVWALNGCDIRVGGSGDTKIAAFERPGQKPGCRPIYSRQTNDNQGMSMRKDMFSSVW